ncbi:unnamed protein product [Effrenium voratum]|nr:unnamed protein product [Effrenium voratum]
MALIAAAGCLPRQITSNQASCRLHLPCIRAKPHFAAGSIQSVAAFAVFSTWKSRRLNPQIRRSADAEVFSVPHADGIELEILGGPATTAPSKVSLVCIHGSYHAAWCYQEHFLDFFREKGFNTYALSLRGQGRGRMPDQLPVAGTLEEHAADIAAFVRHLESKGETVVLVGHSFGGLIALQAAADLQLAGLVLLCSVPPSGNVGIILRSLFRAPLQALRITWGFISRAFERDVALCRELFFDEETSVADIERYMRLMTQGCPAGTRLLDLRQLQRWDFLFCLKEARFRSTLHSCFWFEQCRPRFFWRE